MINSSRLSVYRYYRYPMIFLAEKFCDVVITYDIYRRVLKSESVKSLIDLTVISPTKRALRWLCEQRAFAVQTQKRAQQRHCSRVRSDH